MRLREMAPVLGPISFLAFIVVYNPFATRLLAQLIGRRQLLPSSAFVFVCFSVSLLGAFWLIKSRTGHMKTMGCLMNFLTTGILGLFLWFFLSIEPVQSLWRYGWYANKYVHFPKEIPGGASNVRFYYQPGFMQGAPFARLKMTLPKEQIEKLATDLHEKFPKLTPENSIPTRLWLPPDWGGNDLDELGPEFESFLISPSIEDAKRRWNHPNNDGISVSLSKNEVLYWHN